MYENRISESNDGYYHEAIFITMNEIEVFMYTLGASFPGRTAQDTSLKGWDNEAN